MNGLSIRRYPQIQHIVHLTQNNLGSHLYIMAIRGYLRKLEYQHYTIFIYYNPRVHADSKQLNTRLCESKKNLQNDLKMTKIGPKMRELSFLFSIFVGYKYNELDTKRIKTLTPKTILSN